jgi:RIO-like serine/threonine protein kinase
MSIQPEDLGDYGVVPEHGPIDLADWPNVVKQAERCTKEDLLRDLIWLWREKHGGFLKDEHIRWEGRS